MIVLREALLQGQTIVLAGPARTGVRDALIGLGAAAESFDAASGLDDAGATDWASARAPLHALVFDAAPPFGDGAEAGLQAALEQAWTAVRAVGAGALIPGQTGGRIVLLAPPPDAGAYAQAARSALENLTRTLSVEWARHGILTTVVTPGPSAADGELALLVAFLLSPAGGYFSGCRFELGLIPGS